MPHPTTFFIRPAPDMSADVNPATGSRPCLRIPIPGMPDYLPEKGLLMPRSPYWLRRLKDGDVIEGKSPAAKTRKTEPATVPAVVKYPAKEPAVKNDPDDQE